MLCNLSIYRSVNLQMKNGPQEDPGSEDPGLLRPVVCQSSLTS